MQTARQNNKKAVEILKKVGFTEDNIDPCLYVKKNEKGIVNIALYTDDILLNSNLEAINETVKLFHKDGLMLKVVDGLQDYLLYEIRFSDNKNHGWVRNTSLKA